MTQSDAFSPPSASGVRVSWIANAAGREELRVALVAPYLLQLAERQDRGSVQALAARCQISEALLEDETRWLSAREVLLVMRELRGELGEAALESYGRWRERREGLAGYVGLLRTARTVEEAYRYRAAHGEEVTRLGAFRLVESAPTRSVLEYRPRPDGDFPQNDALLCVARQAELAALPRFWGQGDARVRHERCLDRGDETCVYELEWGSARRPKTGPRRGVTTAAAVATSGLAGALGGLAALGPVGAGLGATLGAGAAALARRVGGQPRRNPGERVAESFRIQALERSLELRSHIPDPNGDLAGTLLAGKYRIGRQIGSGGIGTVYAAEHVGLRTEVAIKFLRGAAARDAAEAARLRREASVQMTIDHPGVVRTLDLDGLPDGTLYIVMELLSGVSLSERLRRGGPLPAAEAARIFADVCRALQAAHELGVVHRDLKASNVFLCSNGRVKLLDFGMGKLADAESLTETGYTLGTPETMSPEQCLGKPLDGRSDVYSVGVLLYQALSGALPFRATDRRELLLRHRDETPPRLGDRRPDLDLPEALERLVAQCLEKRPEARPASAADLADALLAATDQLGYEAGPVSRR